MTGREHRITLRAKSRKNENIMNLVRYSGYWHSYSRLLWFQDGIKIEVSMTPSNGVWGELVSQRIRIHSTQSKGDKIMGIDFMPKSVIASMKEKLGEELTTRLCEFDYLGEMLRIFNTQDVDILRDHLRLMSSNGGIKWEDIHLVEQARVFNELVTNGVLTGVS